ncbi:hypothetical protein GG804_07390 [Sphingomonas histidinilytica]|uniref:hypothetical protein n=1 Tax=Rhizorhabdus histidinilytica TaxID=439228 RepID=UPI001ADCD15B|nr:hypothetical protein [Rhizorhabdus histidinilytica]MBO9376584.1 hypothetical protein [Rhizorhabdus histidinilytica]
MATIAAAPPRPSPRAAWLARRVPASALFGIVAGWLVLDLLLLCRFLGLAQPIVAIAWAVLSGGLAWLLFLPRRRDRDAGPTVATLLGSLAIAMLLLLLGGEGAFSTPISTGRCAMRCCAT